MLEITKNDISDGLDLLMNVPQLRDLNTNKEFKNIFSSLMEDIYLDQPSEILENFRNNPSEKIVQSTFLNYGILPEYYEKLNPIIKRKLIYYLELLFQQKGSTDNLKIISELFVDFFKDINYYGISVNKLPYKLNGVAIPPGELDPLDPENTQRQYILSYFLKPIIISKPELLKYFPNFKIDLTGKYLMKLEQFKRFDVFPMDTNLLYIDFIDSSYLLHSDNYFINGALAYTYTKYQKLNINFDNDTYLKMLDTLQFIDLDTILQYFNLRFIRYSQLGRMQLDPNYTENLMEIDYKLSSEIATSLIFNEDLLDTLEILLLEYKNLGGIDPKKVKDLSRRWQFILQSNYNDNKVFKNFEDLESFMISKYPSFKNLFDEFENRPGLYSGIDVKNLLPEEIIEVSKTDYINFLMNFYINILNNLSGGNEFVELSINGIFQNILNSNIFINYFFTPVFKLFVNYFMPGNMDYIVASSAKVIVKDKFEAIFVESTNTIDILSCFMDARYLPCNKINIKINTKYSQPRYNILTNNNIWLNTIENNNINYNNKINLTLNNQTSDRYNYNEKNDNFNTNIILNKQNNDNIDRMVKGESDNQKHYINKYNFLQDIFNPKHIENYIWKLERNTGITKQIDINKEIYGHFGNRDITPLEDYEYLLKEKLSNIDNYLFFKYYN
jgi:hypothetical protein